MSTPDPTVKNLVVTGNAAEAFVNKGTRRRGRRSSARATTRKEGQEGGTSPGTIVQIQANRAPGANVSDPNALSQAKPSNAANLAKSVTNSTPAVINAAAKEQVGGATKTPVKVILAAGKKKTKVVLAPAKVKKLPGTPGAAPAPSTNKTRKVAKKIRMSLNGFGKRVTRANTIRHDAKKQSIDEVKKTLVEAKLVKADSKAPESVLRQMYADYMTIKNRAL